MYTIRFVFLGWRTWVSWAAAGTKWVDPQSVLDWTAAVSAGVELLVPAAFVPLGESFQDYPSWTATHLVVFIKRHWERVIAQSSSRRSLHYCGVLSILFCYINRMCYYIDFTLATSVYVYIMNAFALFAALLGWQSGRLTFCWICLKTLLPRLCITYDYRNISPLPSVCWWELTGSIFHWEDCRPVDRSKRTPSGWDLGRHYLKRGRQFKRRRSPETRFSLI